MDLEIQKQEILARWKQAFNEIAEIQRYRDKIQTEKYIPGFRFDLKDYGTPLFLNREDRIFPEARSREIGDYHFYGFSADGLPCYTSFAHRISKMSWEGYYSYSDDLVEYVEFCKETGVPSSIKRYKLSNGEKVIYQSIQINGQGAHPGYKSIPREAIIQSIIGNQHSIYCTVEAFRAENGRIVSADCLAIAPGAGEYRYEEIYKYDTDGRLDEKRTVYEDGRTALAYVAPDQQVDINKLAEEVSESMAEAIIETLLEANIEVPLSLVEITYQSVNEYLPLLTPRSLAFTQETSRNHMDEDIFDLIFLATEISHAHIELNPAKFERSFRQFVQIIEREEKWDMGTAMLRRVAYLLTTKKLNNRIPVSDEFAAYAIDWESDMEEFEDILSECGVEGNVIASWKDRGWM